MKKLVPAKLKKITVCMIQSGGLAAVMCQLDEATEAALKKDGKGEVIKHIGRASIEASRLRIPALKKAIDKTKDFIAKSESKEASGMALEKLKHLTQVTHIRTFQKCGAGELFLPAKLVPARR